ncbi:MAG: hypothetical protein IIY49_10845 [Eubacterium sp.]|nr:hypothetical protein [Eubacterium sp.]
MRKKSLLTAAFLLSGAFTVSGMNFGKISTVRADEISDSSTVATGTDASLQLEEDEVTEEVVTEGEVAEKEVTETTEDVKKDPVVVTEEKEEEVTIDASLATTHTANLPYKENNIYYMADSKGNKVTKVGFVEDKYGYLYYVTDSTGKLATGFKTINGKKYYFKPGDSYKGRVATGVFMVGSNCFVADSDGKIATTVGWYKYEHDISWSTTVEDWVYVLDNTGKLKTGWHKQNGVNYYLDPVMQRGVFEVDSKLYVADQYGHVVTAKGWKKVQTSSEDAKWFYFNDDKWSLVQGWKKINGKWYYFCPEMATSTIIYDKDKYYCFDKDGHLTSGPYVTSDGDITIVDKKGVVKDKGWFKSNGKWYYLDGGRLVTDSVKTIDGKKYYFRPDGSMNKGWYHCVDADGSNGWYLSDATGQIQKDGWLKSAGASYYFEDGHTLAGRTYYFKDNKRTYSSSSYDKTYYFDDEGKVANGWTKYGSSWRYYKEGQNYTGWIKSGSDYYYFNDSEMKSNTITTIDGNKYAFKSDGKMVKGWYKDNEYGETVWYYFDNNGKAHEGWMGDYYFKEGKMVTDSIIYLFKDEKGRINYENGSSSSDDAVGAYVIGDDGKYIKGKSTLTPKYGDVTVRVLTDSKTGIAPKDKWVKENGKWYYYKFGVFVTVPSSYTDENYYHMEINDKDYFFNRDGSLVTGWFKYNNVWGYADSNGNLYNGWLKYNGSWYYFEEGGMLVNEYVPDSAGWFAGADGKCTIIKF